MQDEKVLSYLQGWLVAPTQAGHSLWALASLLAASGLVATLKAIGQTVLWMLAAEPVPSGLWALPAEGAGPEVPAGAEGWSAPRPAPGQAEGRPARRVSVVRRASDPASPSPPARDRQQEEARVGTKPPDAARPTAAPTLGSARPPARPPARPARGPIGDLSLRRAIWSQVAAVLASLGTPLGRTLQETATAGWEASAPAGFPPSAQLQARRRAAGGAGGLQGTVEAESPQAYRGVEASPQPPGGETIPLPPRFFAPELVRSLLGSGGAGPAEPTLLARSIPGSREASTARGHAHLPPGQAMAAPGPGPASAPGGRAGFGARVPQGSERLPEVPLGPAWVMREIGQQFQSVLAQSGAGVQPLSPRGQPAQPPAEAAPAGPLSQETVAPSLLAAVQGAQRQRLGHGHETVGPSVPVAVWDLRRQLAVILDHVRASTGYAPGAGRPLPHSPGQESRGAEPGTLPPSSEERMFRALAELKESIQQLLRQLQRPAEPGAPGPLQVTVQAGDLESEPEALSRKLAEILAQEARRYGIDMEER